MGSVEECVERFCRSVVVCDPSGFVDVDDLLDFALALITRHVPSMHITEKDLKTALRKVAFRTLWSSISRGSIHCRALCPLLHSSGIYLPETVWVDVLSLVSNDAF